MDETRPATWEIGDVRITRIVESETALPPQALLPDLTPERLARHESWLKPCFVDGDGQIVLAIQGLLIESAGLRILVDTCVGDRAIPGFEALASPGRRFLDELAAAGWAPEQLDVVLCTHLHFDHVAWNTMRDPARANAWVPTFPKARYLFARIEYEHWEGEAGRAFSMTHDEAVRPIVAAGLADLVETDHRVTEEVRLEATPGHTPGHVAVRIESRGECALITGDLTHHPVQWAEVDLPMPADTDSEEAAVTRRRLRDAHANGPLLVIGTHYASPSSGRLVRDADGQHRFEAAAR